MLHLTPLDPSSCNASFLIESNIPTHQLPLIKRDGENKTGRELRVTINAYPIVKLPTKTVYQYEVRSLHVHHVCNAVVVDE